MKNFTAKKKELSPEGLNHFVKRIATQYANSDGQFSATYFTKAEGITSSCFYRVLDEAVIRNLVSEEIVEKMEQKAISNQQRHCEEAGSRTILHYNDLRMKRREYIIKNLSISEKISIAEYVTMNLDKNLGEIARDYDMNPLTLKKILREVFVNPNTDEEICIRLEERSVVREESEEKKNLIREAFKKLWSERKSQEESPE